MTSQDLAERRQAQSLDVSRGNAELIRNTRGLVLDVTDLVRNVQVQQRDQRRAFNQLARRNEVLHGRDAADAPAFGQSVAEPGAQGSQDTPPPSAEPGGATDGEPGSSPTEERPERPPRRDPPGDPNPDPDPDPAPDPDPSPPPPDNKVCVPLVGVCVDDPR